MDARRLEYFLRTIELGSINRAAAELNLSQPSLSRWLAILERDVGAPLLIRTRQGIRATHAGEILIERIRPILQQLSALRNEIGVRASSQVTFGMPSSMQRIITAPFVCQIAREKPHISLHVHEGLNDAIRGWMERGIVDVGIMVCTERVPDAFSTVPLVVEQLLLVGNAQARLALDSPVSIAQLDNIPMILPGRPNVVRAQVEHAVRRAGGNYNSRFEADTPSLCLELTRRGLGFTIMPYCAVHGPIESAEFTAAPVRTLKVIWAMHINRAREHLASVRNLTSELRAFIAAQISEGQWPFTQFVVDRSRRALYGAKTSAQQRGRRSGRRYSPYE